MFFECPTYKPSMEDMKDLQKYVENFLVPNGAPKYGAAIIIPPDNWKPRVDVTYRDVLLDSRVVADPVLQSVEVIDAESVIYGYSNISWASTLDGKKWCKKNKASITSTKRTGTTINRISLTVKQFQELSTMESNIEDHEDFWKIVREGRLMSIYGTDIPLPLMDHKVAGSWDMNNLCNTALLNLIKNELKVPGIEKSYTYFGTAYSTFAWHTENVDLLSINYLHHGHDKVWYIIPANHGKKFESVTIEAATKLFPNCRSPFRHNPLIVDPVILANKHEIEIYKIIQKQGQFVITFPYAYHCGFNTGLNIAEAANLATECWLPYGITSDRCDCTSDVAFPIGKYITLAKGEEYFKQWTGNNLSDSESLIDVPLKGPWIISSPTEIDLTLHDHEIMVRRDALIKQIEKRGRRKLERQQKKIRKLAKDAENLRSCHAEATTVAKSIGISDATDAHASQGIQIDNRKKKRIQLKKKKAMEKKEFANQENTASSSD